MLFEAVSKKILCLYLEACCNPYFTEINCQDFDRRVRFVCQMFRFNTVWSGFSILKKHSTEITVLL